MTLPLARRNIRGEFKIFFTKTVHSEKSLTIFANGFIIALSQGLNSFKPSVAFHIETSHWFLYKMKHWVKMDEIHL